MKRISLLKLSLIGIFAAIVFISCDNDDNNKIEDSGSKSLTCKINGETFTATSFNNTLIGDASSKRLDIRGTDESGTQLLITINDVDPLGTNFSHIGDTVYVDAFENAPMNIITIGTLIFSNGSFLITSGDGVESGYSIITSFDLTNNKVSGEFEFILIDFQTDDTTYVTEGKYNNLAFTSF